uniref:Uncharacterized protein n=1 Tax=Rhizophora mucronata TaxID=61149 RepID=A0A2P2N6J3_RHIMU
MTLLHSFRCLGMLGYLKFSVVSFLVSLLAFPLILTQSFWSKLSILCLFDN